MTPAHFRAWHPVWKRMIDPKDRDILIVNDRGEPYYFMGSKKCIIQWSTGLNEQTGTDFVEGDIFQGCDGACVAVRWNNGSFVFDGSGAKGSFNAGVLLWLAHAENGKVIGNINENPEMLSPIA
jgi:hypothetical protein